MKFKVGDILKGKNEPVKWNNYMFDVRNHVYKVNGVNTKVGLYLIEYLVGMNNDNKRIPYTADYIDVAFIKVEDEEEML
jgi:hypothetical protein